MTDATPGPGDLAATDLLDHEHDAVRAFTAGAIGDAQDPREQLRRLFTAVRDDLRYDPYSLSTEADGYRASVIAGGAATFCVPKAILFCAGARSLGIPARVGFADVRNHLQSARLQEVMGTDLFVYHGYATVWLDERWVKASPAFNAELCERFGVPPLDFDGRHDALLHAYTGDGQRHMEYVEEHGTFQDVPLQRLFDVYRAAYPRLTEATGAGDERFN